MISTPSRNKTYRVRLPIKLYALSRQMSLFIIIIILVKYSLLRGRANKHRASDGT